MAKVPGFAKAFAGRWCIAQIDERGVLTKRHDENDPAAVADQASFPRAAEFFNNLLVAVSFGLGRALLVGQLRIADSFCKHLAQLGLCLRRFARVEFLKLSHEQHMGCRRGN